MAKPPPEKKIPQFAYTREASLHTYRFPDAPIPDVSMTIEDPEYDKFHRLYATVTSRIGADEIAPSRIDLLNLQHRVDYEHVAAELDGKVPWHNLLLVIVSHLRKQMGSHKEKESPAASPKKTTRQRSEASPPHTADDYWRHRAPTDCLNDRGPTA